MNAFNTELAAQFPTLFRKAPSVFATEPHESRSDKYRFIPTIDILKPLLDDGFEVFKATENRVRDQSKHGFAKHQLRLRHRSLTAEVGGLVPEIILTNSHDGSSAFDVRAGIYRLVCSNGLIVGNDTLRERVRHSGNADDIIEGVYRVLNDIPQALETTRQWSGIQLTKPEQLAYAEAAAHLRWEADEVSGALPVTPESLLRINRWEDNKDDLFTTFNRVQERLIKGGVRAVGSTGKVQRSRAVGSIDQDSKINRALWVLADKFAELKAAA